MARDYVNRSAKITKAKLGITFINTCQNQELLPVFTRLNLGSELKHDEHFKTGIRRKMIEKELDNKHKVKHRLQRELQILQDGLIWKLSDIEWLQLQSITNNKIETTTANIESIHSRKLLKLGVIRQDVLTSSNITSRGPRTEKKEKLTTVHNHSDRKLSDLEIKALSKGLKYGIRSKKVDEYEILSRFEELAQALNRLAVKEKGDELRSNLNSKASFYQQLQSMSTEFIEISKRAHDNMPETELNAFKELAKEKSIVITCADKGNAVVLQNIQDYQNKITDILNTDGKFRKLYGNPTRTRETKLTTYLRSLNSPTIWKPDKRCTKGKRKTKKDHRLPDQVCTNITPSGSRAGVMYGLPKIHKENIPVRPIISAIGTYNYKTAKYLVEILTPLVDHKYILKDTFEFVYKVSTIDPKKDKYLISYDVVSLFTNIPTLETIEIILNRAFSLGLKLFHNLDREELRHLLTVCTQESHFQFNGNYYDQIDGVAMGSPLGPLFANFFMADFEHKHMTALQDIGINIWLRYVDDVFATLDNKEAAEKALDYLNRQHNNIKFTIEHEENNRLPFLDTCVVRHHNTKYTTTMYFEKTFTGLYLNWTSLTARRYKTGLVKCLANRIWRICTDEEEREKELQALKHRLLLNDYPPKVIDHEIDKFKQRKQMQTCQPPPKPDTKRFIVLPYTSKKCEDFAIRLRNLVTSNFAEVDFNVAFQTPQDCRTPISIQ